MLILQSIVYLLLEDKRFFKTKNGASHAPPDVVSAVGKDMPVFIDCGISSGMDVYKCLALGAKAVSVGRHLMPLLKNGPEAIAQRINEMTAELAGIMARTGVKSLDDMDPSVIHRRNF